MQENQRIGISSAAKSIGWKIGRFASYYYDQKTPPANIIDNKPVWNIQDLLNWRDTYPFRGKGRPKSKPSTKGA